MRSFEELDLYKKAREFRKAISILCGKFPLEEKFRLTDQIIRSSRSVTAQIAEGYGRFHYQENIQFCRIARGSLEETQEHLIIALDEGFINVKDYEILKEHKDDIAKLLNGYINYLRRAKTTH